MQSLKKAVNKIRSKKYGIMESQERYNKAIALFDAANGEDPKQEQSGGQSWPKELLYAQRMSKCLEEFMPKACEALRLAARCQHIRRWEIPRQDYPEGRSGYLAWRSRLYDFHAQKASEILQKVAYEEELIQRVCFLLRKRALKHDSDSQALEDLVCLVFLKYYLPNFAKKHSPKKVREILAKTWSKMSSQGQKASLEFGLPKESQDLLKEFLI